MVYFSIDDSGNAFIPYRFLDLDGVVVTLNSHKRCWSATVGRSENPLKKKTKFGRIKKNTEPNFYFLRYQGYIKLSISRIERMLSSIHPLASRLSLWQIVNKNFNALYPVSKKYRLVYVDRYRIKVVNRSMSDIRYPTLQQ